MLHLVLLLLTAVASQAAFPPVSGWRPVLGDWAKPVLTADNSTWQHTAVQEPQVRELLFVVERVVVVSDGYLLDTVQTTA